jgi:hypothetical protein
VSRRYALIIGVTVAAAAAIGMAGCGEKPNVTVYKQGHYQGKPDNLPWQSQPFNNNKADWEKNITARNGGQNEYVRIENR